MKIKNRDWILLTAFIVVDIGAIIYAASYFGTKHQTENREQALATFTDQTMQEERRSVDDLERAAGSGSWEKLNDRRNGMLTKYRETHKMPSRGTALYFFPELLPEQSLERDFAEKQLGPSIAALKAASAAQKPGRARDAFRLLESQVNNYELGASTPATELGEEAKRFLIIYGRVSGGNAPATAGDK